MTLSQDQITNELSNSFHQILRANDIYNVVINRKNSQREDVLESVATLIAVIIDENVGQGDDTNIVNFLEPIIRNQISNHFSSQFFSTTEVFFNKGKEIVSTPSLLRIMEEKLQVKENTLIKFQEKLIGQFKSTFNHLKIGGTSTIILDNIGPLDYRKTGNQEISCDIRNYMTLNSIIDLQNFPVNVIKKEDHFDWTWFLGGEYEKDMAYCSDNNCPCNQNIIPKNEGYICVLKDELGNYKAVLTCESGARARNLDLKSAHNNALNWWRTGRVPFQVTKQNFEEQEAPFRSSISGQKQEQINDEMRALKLKMLGGRDNKKLISEILSYPSYYAASGIEWGIHGPEKDGNDLYMSIYHFLEFKNLSPHRFDTFNLGNVLTQKSSDYKECKYISQEFVIKKFNLNTILDNQDLIEEFRR